MNTFIAHCLSEAVPGPAGNEAAEIVGYYIADNTRLNLVFQAAERFLAHPSVETFAGLDRAVEAAKE